MISFKSNPSLMLAILILILVSNTGIYSPCFGGPIRRLARIERNLQKHKFAMYSSAFKNGEKIPTNYTADGANVSPPLAWGTAPDGTKSFALICEDPDAPMGTWTHWLIYDIPGDQKGLKQGIPADATLSDGTKQGITSFNRVGYGGPSPPKGKPHRYFFKLYALDSMSKLAAATDINSLKGVIKAHTLSESDLMGTYGR
jgi:Raf kinase inhibitor-like YbhB/YbcL family protein